ncbi:hypothetical protein BO86DRAFT_39846 [Aspergillus japonicus CBS 114.51]|uniref:Uncharacterized protein n=2 Tax=Aspergillus TaxID=5052 RepID=A0A2V5H1Q1_ASPV1|nr:hypothetical protein BO86DRAFT_39846 [Aspergillus japonicus CBS 114.51]PYI17818.1 hypothetical protein BO99DRAFT_186620 [Aspergillus violaceofuscus CBS 115571]RAH83480.1 hypothetical protein BO86DRAFT_39846 [Aspergillus japonicus CBS 114.51]
MSSPHSFLLRKHTHTHHHPSTSITFHACTSAESTYPLSFESDILVSPGAPVSPWGHGCVLSQNIVFFFSFLPCSSSSGFFLLPRLVLFYSRFYVNA